MDLKTISEVSETFMISTRTLRYYENIGLLKSTRKEGYSYRVYDEKAILRLQRIIILRKLRIPLRQIGYILNNDDAVQAVEIFKSNLFETENEIESLSTIREILNHLIESLRKNFSLDFKPGLLSDEYIIEAINSIPLQKISIKEEKSMEDLNNAQEKISRLKNVRIIHLPPSTVAASHFIGENPEENAGKELEKFIKSKGLYKIKPDAKVYGFNHPNPSRNNPVYGYEVWVTIPENMEVPAPLVKKYFEGGMYAAHMIKLGDFHEWKWLMNWVNESAKYESNCLEDNGETMHGLLEEQLNYVYYCNLNWPEEDEHQLDLLFPVKLR